MIRHKRKTLKLGRSLGKMYSSIPIETISNSKDTEDTTTNKNVVNKKKCASKMIFFNEKKNLERFG